jgi:hypothetical protein
MYLKRLWYSGNNMFGFHECELEIQEYKNIKTDTLWCHVRLHKKLVRVFLGFRLGLGVRDSVGAAVVVVRHRIFNRHLDVPWDKPSSYIPRRCSNFKLVWVCKRLSTSFWPRLFFLFEWIQPSIDQLCTHADAKQGNSTTLWVTHIRSGQGLKNVLPVLQASSPHTICYFYTNAPAWLILKK